MKTESSYDAFLGYFSVPDTPAAYPQILYLFTGPCPRGRTSVCVGSRCFGSLTAMVLQACKTSTGSPR